MSMPRSTSVGPHRARQAVVGVVGDGHGVVVGVVGDERQHRAEDLLLGDRHRVVDVGEQGRLDVPALVEAGGTTAADDDGGAFGLAGLGDVALDPVALALGHERPALGRRDRADRRP